MILYHFTDFWFLKNGGTILEEGLKPTEPLHGTILPSGVVWFTTEADPVIWWGDGERSECRITVVIPSTDKRLVRWEVWLRKHVSADEMKEMTAFFNTTGIAWKAFYVYRGAVPLSRFRAVEYADPNRRAIMAASLEPSR